MANQESGNVKQMKMRLPMSLYLQLQIDAEKHGEDPSTRARHILVDQLMSVDISGPAERARLRSLVEDNWEKIRGAKAKKQNKNK